MRRTPPAYVDELRAATAAMAVADLTSFAPPADAQPRPGAVLLLFGGDTHETAEVLLTQRAPGMRSHPGQVSFPGGAIDPDETAHEAALREAAEETDLDAAEVEVVGALPELWLPPSNFLVTPIVGWWHSPGEVRVVDPGEVAAIYRVSLTELLDPAHRFSVRGPRGWVGPGFWIGDAKDVLLWGFTAGVLSRLFAYVGWERPWDADRVLDLPEALAAADEARQ